jgi:hypothetical protein
MGGWSIDSVSVAVLPIKRAMLGLIGRQQRHLWR